MQNRIFIPVTDDIIYNHPEQIEGSLVPYSSEIQCHRWLSIEINPEEKKTSKKANPHYDREPHLTLAYSAV